MGPPIFGLGLLICFNVMKASTRLQSIRLASGPGPSSPRFCNS